MLLITQIHLGSNMIADGTLLLTDAADQGGYAQDGSMTATELDRAITNIRKMLTDLEQVRAALRDDKPVRVNQLVAAE